MSQVGVFLVTTGVEEHMIFLSVLLVVRCLTAITYSAQKASTHTMYEQPTYNSKRSHKLLLLESAVVSQPPCEKFKFAEI